MCCFFCLFFFFKQKTAYEMRISDWSSDVCSSDLFTLTEVECIGNCANAPVVQINDDNYEDLDYDSMTRILDALAAGEQPRTGTQNPGRRTSDPEGGPTTLVDMVSANHDYRKEW